MYIIFELLLYKVRVN